MPAGYADANDSPLPRCRVELKITYVVPECTKAVRDESEGQVVIFGIFRDEEAVSLFIPFVIRLINRIRRYEPFRAVIRNGRRVVPPRRSTTAR